MNKAIFFDRDGVINEEIFNKKINQWSAPHTLNQVKIRSITLKSLKNLNKKNFLLFIVSNQPDYAKGNILMKDLKLVHKKIKKTLDGESIKIERFFYSYKHPKSIKKGYGLPCFDRKPNPFFLKMAKKLYNLDFSRSWMIGDRTSDIECGFRSGVKTIGLLNKHYCFDDKRYKPDFLIKNINQVFKIIK